MTAPNYDDDLSNAYLRQRESRQASSDREYLDSFISGGTQETAEPAPRQEIGENDQKPWYYRDPGSRPGFNPEPYARAAGKVAWDIGKGVLVQSPFQVIGGIEEGLVNAPLQAIHEFGTWANENLADLGEFSYTPETGLQYTSHAKAKEIAEQYGYDPNTPFALPVPDEADTVTGGIIRNISKYVSGFIGAGKLLKVAGVPAAATAAGKVGEFMLRGAMADAIEFGPNDPRLADLLQKAPGLQKPVFEYLASDPEDGAAEGRFKNAVEGLGLGVAGLALGKVLKAVRAGGVQSMFRRVLGVPEEAGKSLTKEIPDDLSARLASGEAQLPIRMVKREDIETLLSDRPVQRALKVEDAGNVKPEDLGVGTQKLEAYHGTGATFDKFSMEKVGTGEGAQAYGYGLYFSETPEVAGEYRKVLTGGWANSRNADRVVFDGATDSKLPYKATLEDGTVKRFATEKEAVGWVGDKSGSLYSVSLRVRPEELLDWDKPLREQSDEVQRALRPWINRWLSNANNLDVNFRTLPDVLDKIQTGSMTGKELYGLISAETYRGSMEGGSKALAEAGIPGLRYLDQGSRGAGEGTRNIVMFDDSLISIKTRNGEPLSEAVEQEVRNNMLPEGGEAKVGIADEQVYINWARIDSDKDIKRIIQDLADAQAPDINKARRGVQTWEQTQLNAAQEDAWKILTERRKGEPLGPQQSLAVRQLWVTSAEKVKSLAEEAVVNPSDANLFAFRKMMAIHNTIQKQVIAARTETARALNAWAIPAGSDVELSRDIGDIIEFMGGTENSRKIAEKVAMLGRGGNAKELEAFIEMSTWARTREAISAFWYAALLSGPKTHARNMLSNSFVAAQQIYERKAANLIGQMLGEENIVPGESMALLYGTIEGTKDALRVSAKGRRILREAGEVAMQGQEGREAARQMLAHGEGEFGTFYRSMATGKSGYGVGKLETPTAGAYSSEKWALDPESNIGQAMDMLDAVMSLPGRALMAEDELFKTIGYRAELHAQAHRKVAQEIASGALENTPEAMKARAAEIILDPNETIRLAAMDAAAYRTFTQRAGPLASGLSHAINNPKLSPYLRGLGIIVWPFRRTPSGIFRYGFERTPLAPMFKHVQADLAAGGAQRDLALARMATGSVILAAAMDLAMSGHVTGQGPANPNQRATMRRMGIQPDSFKVGDRYFSYRGTEPVSQTLGIAANIVEILKNTDWEDDNVDVQRMFIAAAISIGYQTTSATYMQGLSDFFDAMGDPVRYGEGYFQKLARSFVPAASAEVTRFIDPNMRAVEDMIDAMYARTPGLSKTLPLNHDAWGHTKSYRSGLGTIYDAMSPSYSSKANASDIDKELNRLELWNGKPPKRVSFSPDMIRGIPGSGSVSVNLSKYPEAYERYVELQGDLMTHTADGAPIDASGLTQFQSLNALVSGVHPLSVSYGMGTEGSDGQKATMIRSIRDKFRRAARAQLLNEFPELRQEVIRRMPQEWIGQ